MVKKTVLVYVKNKNSIYIIFSNTIIKYEYLKMTFNQVMDKASFLSSDCSAMARDSEIFATARK